MICSIRAHASHYQSSETNMSKASLPVIALLFVRDGRLVTVFDNCCYEGARAWRAESIGFSRYP